jgi:hypothetical protein
MLTPGTRPGPYEILVWVDAVGMGEVYCGGAPPYNRPHLCHWPQALVLAHTTWWTSLVEEGWVRSIEHEIRSSIATLR